MNSLRRLLVLDIPNIFWTSSSTVSLARERKTARYWMLRALQLREEEDDFKKKLPDQCLEVLKNKKILVFEEMIKAFGYGDKNIAKDISHGFDLMGTLPSSNIFESKSTFGTLLPEHVRMVSNSTRKAISNSSRHVNDKDVASEICRITEEEVKRRWLKGPLKFRELPPGSWLTKTFGVKQTSSSSSGQQVVKVRPIGDFSKSLINSAVTCNERISIHSANVIAAGTIKRLKMKKSEACEPFGAKAAVQGLCRASNSLWFLGPSIFNFHWTVYFHDFSWASPVILPGILILLCPLSLRRLAGK